MVFLTFLKFSLKFRKQIPCKKADSNALNISLSRKLATSHSFIHYSYLLSPTNYNLQLLYYYCFSFSFFYMWGFNLVITVLADLLVIDAIVFVPQLFPLTRTFGQVTRTQRERERDP
jgi:hypothetical protein